MCASVKSIGSILPFKQTIFKGNCGSSDCEQNEHASTERRVQKYQEHTTNCDDDFLVQEKRREQMQVFDQVKAEINADKYRSPAICFHANPDIVECRNKDDLINEQIEHTRTVYTCIFLSSSQTDFVLKISCEKYHEILNKLEHISTQRTLLQLHQYIIY